MRKCLPLTTASIFRPTNEDSVWPPAEAGCLRTGPKRWGDGQGIEEKLRQLLKATLAGMSSLQAPLAMEKVDSRLGWQTVYTTGRHKAISGSA